MTDPVSHPSRLLRWLAWLARWSLGLLLAAALVLAVAWGALHGAIVPRIGEYRVQLQAQAERALGVPVRIGTLSAYTQGLIPSIELGEVALLDAQGREALRLQRVVLALSPRSLWRFGFEQLYIERPELDIRRDRTGQVFIAGLPLPGGASDDSRAVDWLFSQPEVVVRGGTVRWTDEQRAAAPLALSQVDVLLRNGAWRHQLRLDATPPPQWGDRFHITGLFRQPLLSTHSGRWQQWSGQLFANFARVDVSRLHLHADLGVALAQGRGALRAWLNLERGQWVGAVADVALANVNATLAPDLEPLRLPSVQGRLGARRLVGGFEFSTQGLQWVGDDGLHWPGGNLRVRYTNPGGKAPLAMICSGVIVVLVESK